MALIIPADILLKNKTIAKIRSAITSDAAATLQLYENVIVEKKYTLASVGELQKTVVDEVTDIQKKLAHPVNVYIVASVGDDIVGMAKIEQGFYKKTAHFADIHSVWVAKKWRNLGLGKAMMQIIINWAENSLHIKKLGLFVFSSNENAIKLYREIGFVVEGRSKFDMQLSKDNYVDTIIMGYYTQKIGGQRNGVK